jgi:hypothetical protein
MHITKEEATTDAEIGAPGVVRDRKAVSVDARAKAADLVVADLEAIGRAHVDPEGPEVEESVRIFDGTIRANANDANRLLPCPSSTFNLFRMTKVSNPWLVRSR